MNIAEEMERGRSRVRAALVAADGMSGRQVGENDALSKRLDLPPALTASVPELVMREKAIRQIEQDEGLVDWASRSKENAALARDDIEGLAGVFAQARAFGGAVADFGNDALHWALFDAAKDVPEIVQNVGRSLTHGAADFNRSLVGGAQAVTENILGAQSLPARALQSVQDWIDWARPEDVPAETTFEKLAYGFLRSAPQQVGNIVGYAANPAAALALMGVQIGGGTYADLREHGVSPQKSMISGAGSAIMQLPFERLGFDRFFKIFKSTSARDTLMRTFGAAATEGLTEYVQTYPDLAARLWGLAEKESPDAVEQLQWFGRTLFDAETLWKAHNEGMYAFGIGSLWGLLGGGVRGLAMRDMARQRAEDFAKQNISLHEAVEASETWQVAPDRMADALESASDVLAQSVYIPARAALELAEQGRDVLTPLGISVEQARWAAETDIDLEVKLSEVHSRLDAEGMAALAPIMRQRADAPNALEAEQMDNAAQAQAVVEESRVRQRVVDAVKREEKRLVAEMTPLVGKKAAETFGRLHAEQARAFETAYGVDAAGLMQRRSVELGRGDAQGEALQQAALYEQTPLGETARASLERDSRDFGAAVDNIVAAGKLPSSPVKMLGQTPLVMRLLGRDTVTGKAAAQGGVYAAPHVFDGTHFNMTPEMWKQIPGALADPVAVFDSDSPAGRARGDLVFMLELTDADGATVVVPVALDAPKGRNQAHVNIVKSAYAKESGGVPANKWFLRQLKKNARYVNGQKMKPWLRAAGADSPLGSWKDLAAANASGNRIYTDADLVKLREAQLKLYQSEDSGDSPTLRAQVTLDAETAAIRIFKGADLSSIPHESAHIFVDDLRRVAVDDGSIARERLRADLEQSGMDATPLAGILSGELDAEGARSLLREAREELAMLDAGDAGLREAAKVPAKGESGREGREDIRAALKANAARRREILPLERALAAHVRRLDGLEQARRDMATLRRFAGVNEDGELTDAQWRDVQEYAARGFEQYLMEGKAPSKALEGVFSRMMQWIKSIYRSFRQMGDYVGRELNDDVRRVFDRLLAADAQVRDDPAVRAALETEADFLADADLTLDERLELDDLRGRAEAEVLAAMARATARERGKRYRAAFDEAKRTLQNAPFWRFVAEMTRRESALDGGPSVGGIRRDSLVEHLGEDMARDIAKKMPRLINAKGGGSLLDTLALEYHLTDGDADALAHMIYDAVVVNDGSVNKLAARMAQQTLEEQDGKVSPDAGLLAGDAYGAYLTAVEKTMRRLYKARQAQNEQAAAQRMERESLPESYYRKLARHEIGGLPVERLSAGRYEAALRRALEERTRAMRQGKPLDAVRAMQRARMAFALMQEARTARETVDRVRNKAVRAARVKPGTYPAAQTEAIRQLVSGVGLAAPSAPLDAEVGDMSLADLVTLCIGDTSDIDLQPLFADWLLKLENPDAAEHRRGVALNWKKLLPEEVEQVENLLDFLVHSAREQSRTDKNSLRARVEAVADAAAANMSSLKTFYPGERNSVHDNLQKGWSSIDAVEWLCRKADGFQNVMGRKTSTEGVMERDVYMGLRAATDRYHTRLAGTQRAVTPHLVRLLQSAKQWERKYGGTYLNIRDEAGNVLSVPERLKQAGVPGWKAETVIGMALNMGNAGNRERLRSSYRDENGNGGLTYDDVSLLLGDDAAITLFGLDAVEAAAMTQGRKRRDGILSAEDWKAIQGVWDVFGSQWADTQAAHKKLYGFAPQGIAPGAFVVRVGDEVVNLAGGYYPIRYETRLDATTKARDEKAEMLERSESIAPIPAARRGFTMKRVAHTGKSLRLDVSGLQQHLADSARLIELGYDVRMADRIITSPAFAAEYQRAFGMDEYARWRPNLKGMVVDEAAPDSFTWKMGEAARKGLTYYALSGNLKTAFMQLTAVFPAINDIGAVNVARGMAQLSTQGMGLVRAVWEASPYMKRRFRNMDADLAGKAMRFSPGRGLNIIYKGKVYTWDDIADLGMLPIALTDCIATTAIWAGAYHKKMKQLRAASGWKIDMDAPHHAEAVAYADKMIAMSNPDNDALSKSAFGRDKGVVRMFNIFSGATTKFAQRTRYMWQGMRHGRVTPWEFARMELYDMMFPAVCMVVATGLAQGLFGGDDDDRKELAELALTTTLSQAAVAVPVYGNLIADTISAAAGAGTGRRAGLETPLNTPIGLIGNAFSGGGKAVREGEIGDRMLLNTLDLASFVSRVPIGPVYRRASRGYEQWQRGDGTPFSIIMPRPGK